MPKLANWVKESVSGTPGTGTISLGGAVTGFCRFQDQFTTGDVVKYVIEDGDNKESGLGTLTTGTPWTLARTVVQETINSGTFDNTSPSALSLTSSAIVGIAGSADTTGIVVGRGYASINTVVTCSTAIPYDDTIPQNTEGTEVITLAYVRKFSDSILQVQSGFWGTPNGSGMVVVGALFQDTTASALEITAFSGDVIEANNGTVYTELVSGAVGSTTFKLRVGGQSGTFYVNAGAGTSSRYYGGAGKAYIKVTEIRQ